MKMPRNTLQIIRKMGGLMTLVMLLLWCLSLSTVAQEELEEETAKPCPKPYAKIISPRAAQPLTEVKIRGSRFGTEPGSVTFSPGVEGKIISWSYKRIFVEVPEDAQSGPVTVTSPCGSVSNDQYFTVEVKKGEAQKQQDNPWESDDQEQEDNPWEAEEREQDEKEF